jgi:4-diphosphocytidyl-2-C-methyl-D-erythritol kinase
MILFPPAKINLGLHVGSKREDGYHELESIMFQIPWCDILEIVPSETLTFHSTGLKIPGESSSNLCLKAYHLLKEKYNIPPVSIHLHKIIPMGAGLGGGSSDGTYTLLILTELFNLKLSLSELRTLALELGSDCPLFVENSTQLAKGRGEVLSPIEVDLKGKYIYLVNKGLHVSTKDAFSNLKSKKLPEFLWQNVIKKPTLNWRNFLKNDFENSVFEIHPSLQEEKEKLYKMGAKYVSMTGSGSTIYAIFDENPENYFTDEDKKILQKIVCIE